MIKRSLICVCLTVLVLTTSARAALLVKHASTSNVIRVVLKSSLTGQGLAGLTNSASGLVISTIASSEPTAITYTSAASNVEAITTLGTYEAPSSGKCRFKEVNPENHPGLYEIQLADARFAVSGAKSLVITVSGAANLLTTDYEIQFVGYDPTAANLPANVTQLLGTAWLTPGTAGTPDVNVKLLSGDSTAADNAEKFFDGTGYGPVAFSASVTDMTGTLVHPGVGTTPRDTVGGVAILRGVSGQVAFRRITDEGDDGSWYFNVNSAISFTPTTVDVLAPAFFETDRTAATAIKTKTDFLPSATAGSAGGLFIAGSNAPTTLAALSVSGATTLTGNVALANGLTITQATANQPGIYILGNGAAVGIEVAGGATGGGAFIHAGGGNGSGIISSGFGSGVSIGGSLSGSVGSIGTSGITAASFAPDAIDANSTAADFLAEVNAEVAAQLVAKGLDHLLSTSVTGTDVADNSIIARFVSKSATADWDSFNNTTDSLEALRDNNPANFNGLTITNGRVDANVTHWLSNGVNTTVPGVPQVDITHLLGSPVCD